MNCTPCRVTFKDTRYEIARDGSVSETGLTTEGAATVRWWTPVTDAVLAKAVRAEAQRQRRNRNARTRADALRALGMKRTRTGQWE